MSWYLSIANSQTPFSCGFDDPSSNLILHSSIYKATQNNYEIAYQRYITHAATNSSNRNGIPYTFPVVFHIIHDCSPIGSASNPDNATIKSILDKTSQRFRHQHDGAKNYDNPRYGADTEIGFCLAKIDPAGNYTNGVVRYANQEFSRSTSSEQAFAFKDLYRWNPDKYINIFIVADTDVSGIYLGGEDWDFIIINASSFWDGLLAHEIGHYFSLKHTFSPDEADNCTENLDCLSDGDFVCDTPPKNTPGRNGGTCEIPSNSCISDEADTSEQNPFRSIDFGGMGDQPDMLSNYMDYTGSCWDAFTEGQKERMHFNISSQRSILANQNNLICNNDRLEYEVSVEQVELLQENCSEYWQLLLSLKNNGTQVITNISTTISINGDASYFFQPTFELAPNDTISLPLSNLSLPIGSNNLEISISNPNGKVDMYQNNNLYCLYVKSVGTSGLASDYEASFSTCQIPTALSLDNSNLVSWEVGEAGGDLESCHTCFALVQAFAETEASASLCLPKMDLSNASEARLQFTLGYIPRYTFIDNELSVTISAECNTEDTIYQAKGLDLATNVPPAYSENESFRIPNCEELKRIEVDLKEYIGKNNISICFAAKGRWFSPMILTTLNVDLELEENETATPPPPVVPTTMADCEPIEVEEIISACEGETVQGYIGPGVFRDTFRMADGCDSIRILNLVIASKRVVTQIEKTICAGNNFEGHNKKGSYIDLFTTRLGCDSIRVLDLFIQEVSTTTQSINICEGDNHNGWTVQGTYVDTLSSVLGCDSLSITKLSVEFCGTTSTKEIKEAALLSLFPTPATHQASMSWEGGANWEYTLFSMNGKSVSTTKKLLKTQLIPLSHFKAGLYWIQFTSPKGVFIKKLLVQ